MEKKKDYKKNFVSIIIVNWNGGHILKQCVDSILEHCKNQNYEIIVVDNNSTDDSIEMIKDYKLKIIKEKTNHGFAVANNIGLKSAIGEYVLLLNSDTVFLDDNITINLNHANKEDDNTVMFTTKLLNKDLTIQRNVFRIPTFLTYFYEYILRFRNSYRFDYNTRNYVEATSGAYMLIKHDFLEDKGLFDEAYYFYQEDTDLCKKIAQAGKRILFLPYSPVIHLGGYSTKEVKAEMLIEMHKNRYIYIKKYYGKLYFFSFKVLTRIGLLVDILVSGTKVLLRKMTFIEYRKRLKSIVKIFIMR